MNCDESIDARATSETVGSTIEVSVVLATFNRLDLLKRVLGFLREQTYPANQFEVIVVDDGSDIPAAEHCRAEDYPFSLTVLRQDNAGPAAARHWGVLHAHGRILLFIDDDMQLRPNFIEAHLSYHRSGRPTAVIGRYISDPEIHRKPLFERYHGLKWDILTEQVREGQIQVDGTCLATGNTSMRREDYLRVGGFDVTLPRAEDIALGLALEEIGVELVYSDVAGSIHLSDHTSPEKWMGRAHMHGLLEPRIAERFESMVHADPWRFAFSLPAVGRLMCLPSVLSPPVGKVLARAIYRTAEAADSFGLERVALRATGLVFGMEYFRGITEQAGSMKRMYADCVRFLGKAAKSNRVIQGVPKWLTRISTQSHS